MALVVRRFELVFGDCDLVPSTIGGGGEEGGDRSLSDQEVFRLGESLWLRTDTSGDDAGFDDFIGFDAENRSDGRGWSLMNFESLVGDSGSVGGKRNVDAGQDLV